MEPSLVQFDEYVDKIVVSLLDHVQECLNVFEFTRAYSYLLVAEHAFQRAASIYFNYAKRWTEQERTMGREKLESLSGDIHGARDVIQTNR